MVTNVASYKYGSIVQSEAAPHLDSPGKKKGRKNFSFVIRLRIYGSASLFQLFLNLIDVTPLKTELDLRYSEVIPL